jgi:Zn-dependent metalloprotease
MTSQISGQKPAILFYSYFHKDERLRDALATHLSLLKRENMIKEWHDRDIHAGEDWREAIDKNLEAADIILLLVSADFIASEYCWGKEMLRAVARHDAGEARVIPIILRDVDWSGAPFGRLQALPKNAKPVVLWTHRDVAWADVAKGISKVAKALAANLPVEQTTSGPTILPSIAATPVENSKHRLAERPGGQLQRKIYNAENSSNLPGKVARSEGDLATGDVAVDEAYDWLGITYNFFCDVFERNSIDDKGIPLEATVHFDQNYDNAFWNGKQIILGDGDGELFNRFSIDVDIIAKEFANGVIGAATQLVYWQQSGALFNSASAVFASLVKQYARQQTASQADWLVGARLLATKVNGKALFSLAEPGTAYNDATLGKDPQPAHMRNYVRTTDDSGGIHINSSIPCRAFYLTAIALGGYAWEKAGRIWYETLRDKQLKPKAQFRDFARVTLANARRLYGDNSDETQAVRYGWEMVGLKVVTS